MGKKHWNSHQKFRKDRKPGGEKPTKMRTKDERRKTVKRRNRQREATTATTDREDSAQREDPVAKELRCDRVTKEVEEE